MNARYLAARAPAMSQQEAALLPALTRETNPALPSNLLIPRKDLHFQPVESCAQTVDNFPRRRGSMAGRAVLRMVQRR